MAVTALSTVTSQILFQSGEVGPIWCRTNGADIKPGMVVTKTGETINTPDIDIPGAANEISLGIVGLLPNQDLDTAYADNTIVPVYPVGGGAVVWGWATAGDADKVPMSPLMHSHAGADGFTLIGELINEYVGRTYRDTVVDATDDTPMLIHMV